MGVKKTQMPSGRGNGRNGRAKPKTAPRLKQAKSAIAPPPNVTGPTVVGIAGSAGSLAALQSFFGALPAETNMAFVVITHLSPDHESHLASLLQPHTQMAVTQVNRKLLVKPNQVYVIPPSKNILITDAHVDVADFEEPRNQRTPIDFFFRSLARSHRDAVAIILSGGGTDGSVGVKQIKEEGGLIMVQDPEEAEYPSMPNAAISTGLVDVILSTRALAARLIEYARHIPELPRDIETLEDHEWGLMQAILAQVQRRTKHDFSQYKRSTILRRVRRRMLLNSHPTLEMYLEHVRTHPAESFALLNDLLIGVTNFFRDHPAWDALKAEVLPSIFKNKGITDPIRVWSVGCASGEEAYSLAIVLLEVAASLDENRTIQIFASDIDDDSLARSREGLYPAAIEADVSPERLERFFVRQANHYQVRRELRDMLLFTPHSVLRDPPFSHQDLIVCRNLLIYLQRDIQQYVLDIFHYSLNPGGFLFLGNSETAAGKEDLFQTLDKGNHIYQTLPWRSEIPHVPTVPLVVRRTDQPHALAGLRPMPPRPSAEPYLLEEQHRKSLETFGPPSILVSGDYTILHVSDTAGRYLNQPKGPITSELLRLARPELQAELRACLFQALEKNRSTVSAPLLLHLDGVPRLVIISVNPRTEPTQSGQAAEKQALIVFLEDDPLPEPLTEFDMERAEGRNLDQLTLRASQFEVEVRRLRDQLQSTQEEYDSSTEEMKAANEELQSINEEYHLTTEELETSKEELEAVNEELQTVNNELKGKLDEISRAHRDLENVMGAMEIATLFLDHGLRIVRYTPGLSDFFNILKTDIGRPIDHLSNKLGDYAELARDAQHVLNTLSVIDREVRATNGEWYLIRLRPYRTIEDKIEGVVITFVDVTPLKKAENQLRQLNETLEGRVETRTQELQAANLRLEQISNLFSTLFNVNPIPTSLTRLEDGRFIDINVAYTAFFGVTREEAVGRTSRELLLPFQGSQRAVLVREVKKNGVVRDVEMELTLRSGEHRTVLASLQYLDLDSTEALLSAFIDITPRVEAERQVRTLAASLTAAEQKERYRISKILHDDLQQRLFAIKMQLSFLRTADQGNSQEGVQAEVEDLENWLSDAIETTRRLSVDLSPVILQGKSLSDSVAWLVDDMRERYGLDTDYRVKGELPDLDDHLRVLLFEALREFMFNVVKHSDVLKADLVLEHAAGNVRVSLTDHGKGFDTERVLNDPKTSRGLLDMSNRLQLLGCEMSVVSRPGDGTQITIEVPV